MSDQPIPPAVAAELAALRAARDEGAALYALLNETPERRARGVVDIDETIVAEHGRRTVALLRSLAAIRPSAALPRLEEREKEPGHLYCYDCGREYGDEHGFPDLVVDHDVWNQHISPTGNEGGLLCPSCMCQRAAAAGLSGVRAEFRSGPFSSAALPRMVAVEDVCEVVRKAMGADDTSAAAEPLRDMYAEVEAALRARFGGPEGEARG